MLAVDMPIFSMMGRCINEGMVPYQDLFDHKGPILYFIYAFADWLYRGVVGVYILQIVSLAVCLEFLYKTVTLFSSRRNAYIVNAVFLVCFLETIEGGGLTEEWSLPFLFIAMYLAIKSVLQDKFKYAYTMVYGIGCASLFLIRPNNIAIIAGILVGLTILFVVKQRYISLLKHFIMFLLCVVLVALPICLYFYQMDAMNDFLNAFLFFNFKYSSDSVTKVWLKLYWVVSLTAVYFITRCCNTYNRKLDYIFIPALVITLVSVSMGYGYLHYYTLTLPLYSIFAAILIDNRLFLKNKVVMLGLTASMALFIVMFVRAIFNRNTIHHYFKDEHPMFVEFKKMHDMIPASERNYVLTYNFNPSFYFMNDMLPPYKYFFLQDFLGSVDEDIRAEIDMLFQDNPPHYVLIDSSEGIANPVIYEIVRDQYRLIYSRDLKNKRVELYKLNKNVFKEVYQ